MPQLTDPAAIRAILETDRSWSVYALGDLVPAFFEHCRWFTSPGDGPALLLLYERFQPPVLLTLGTPERIAPLLDEIRDVRTMCLHIRPDILPLVKRRYTVHTAPHMWRMVLDPVRFHAVPLNGIVQLGSADVPALQRLYADGDASGEAPDFFFPSMLDDAVFFGVRDGNELIAAAGTHLVAPLESVAAVGNIYTRRDRRGRGLGTAVTAAVTAELRRRGVRTIGLNVNQRNATAIGLYERLGFVRYCAFVEGVATR